MWDEIVDVLDDIDMEEKNMSMKKAFAPKNYIVGKYAVGTSCFSTIDIGRKEVLGEGS